jgi:GAF domain-containing protein
MAYRAVSGTAEGSLGLRLRRDTSLSGLCVLRSIPLRCDDAETDPRVDREACRRVGVPSTICVPLVHAGTAVGALKVISPQREAFGDVDLVLLGLMSEIVAFSMSHAEAFERHRHDGSHDSLTGLPNRRAFDEAVREERSRALRSHTPLSLVLFDLDRFKEINDRFGHPAGDVVLRRFSEILERLRDAVAGAELGDGLIGVSAGSVDAAVIRPRGRHAFRRQGRPKNPRR